MQFSYPIQTLVGSTQALYLLDILCVVDFDKFTNDVIIYRHIGAARHIFRND